MNERYTLPKAFKSWEEYLKHLDSPDLVSQLSPKGRLELKNVRRAAEASYYYTIIIAELKALKLEIEKI